MAEELYERYKDALRTGHVAVLRGHLPDALVAYRRAAEMAPDRAMPHTSLGGVLLRLGHVDEALFEYDVALQRSPRDEAVLLGRAEALVAGRRYVEAASSLDGAAEVQAASGRVPEAIDTLGRAVELEDTPDRRRRRDAMEAGLTRGQAEVDAADDLGRSLVLLEAVQEDDVPYPSGPDVRPAADFAAVEGGGPANDETPVRVDLAALEAEADRALDRGGGLPALDVLVALARARGDEGLLDAALDAANIALSIAPADAAIHLALVDLYLVHGWRNLAADKLALLGRLGELTEDERAAAEVRRAVALSFPDDARLARFRE